MSPISFHAKYIGTQIKCIFSFQSVDLKLTFAKVTSSLDVKTRVTHVTPPPPPKKKLTAIKGTLGLHKTLTKIVSPLNPLKFSGSATAVIFEGSCSSFDELKKDGVVIQHIEF